MNEGFAPARPGPASAGAAHGEASAGAAAVEARLAAWRAQAPTGSRRCVSPRSSRWPGVPARTPARRARVLDARLAALLADYAAIASARRRASPPPRGPRGRPAAHSRCWPAIRARRAP
ncbi:hypothetical protein [Burkholderia glumae]|uniref:hypothetical protein n=1 Tax=Burkholderia glumae TaxID=337 RepID=UPI003F569622